MKPSHTIRPVFDDPNLVSAAGLVPALRLAGSAGFYDLLEGLTVASPNASAKTAAVVGGMLAGADSIDDLDLLRHGGMDRLFAGVRAPSTLGTFLRSFTHGHVQQLDKIGGGLLSGLAARVPGLLAGGGAEGIAFLDVDDTVRELRREAGPALDRLASSAQSLASRSRELAAEARDRAREKAQGYVDATGRHVSEKPVQSLLLGVAAGALIGTLLASRRRR